MKESRGRGLDGTNLVRMIEHEPRNVGRLRDATSGHAGLRELGNREG